MADLTACEMAGKKVNESVGLLAAMMVDSKAASSAGVLVRH